MNKNEFAKIITLKEGKKIAISVAQVKEVLKIIVDAVSTWEDKDIIKFFKGKRGK